jgi:Skp family chaperone for outer membrane proteins
MIADTLAAVLWTLAAAATPPAVAAPSSASTQPITGGPLVAGVCVISPDAVLADSKVGQAANSRLHRYADQAHQETQTERAALEAEVQDLKPGKTPMALLQQRREALSAKAQSLQAKSDDRNRTLEYTRVKVIERISREAQPLIASAYAAHGCGLLLRRDHVLGGNLGNDLTAEVVRSLDARLTTLDFQLQSPPTPAKPAV